MQRKVARGPTFAPSRRSARVAGQRAGSGGRRRLYFRRSVWDADEAHLAEQHFYGIGHTPEPRRMTQTMRSGTAGWSTLAAYQSAGLFGAGDSPPPGFHAVSVLASTSTQRI
jgi:hypothetical protein